MAHPFQADRSKPFHREFEEAWNKLREGRPWIPEMHIEKDAVELLQELQDELREYAESSPMTEPQMVSRLRLVAWWSKTQHILEMLESAQRESKGAPEE